MNVRWAGLVGDLNDILSNLEKVGGPAREEWSFKAFRSFVSNCGLVDLGYVRHPYTWNNRRDGASNVRECLDRAIATYNWQICFPNATIFHLLPVGSDHCPFFFIF